MINYDFICTVCVQSSKEVRTLFNQRLSMEWGKVKITPEIEDEQEGKDGNLGIEGSNSNGHGKEKDKEGHIMKIIEGLQREAQARQADSQKLMKVRDR
jgi:hypothetical protein